MVLSRRGCHELSLFNHVRADNVLDIDSIVPDYQHLLSSLDQVPGSSSCYLVDSCLGVSSIFQGSNVSVFKKWCLTAMRCFHDLHAAVTGVLTGRLITNLPERSATESCTLSRFVLLCAIRF